MNAKQMTKIAAGLALGLAVGTYGALIVLDPHVFDAPVATTHDALAAALAHPQPQAPAKPSGFGTPEHPIPQNVVDALQAMIVLNGYDCASVEAVARWLFSEGYSVSCNGFRYNYEIANHGGRWSVKAD